MKFLNEIALFNPKAISFASGRPDSSFFMLSQRIQDFNNWFENLQTQEKNNLLGQYSSAKGWNLDLWVKYLADYQNIITEPKNLILSTGTQEAMLLSILSCLKIENEVVIVENPSYPGMSELSKILNKKILSVDIEEDGINLEQLDTILKNNSVKLIYLMPDFQNPMGFVMSQEKRQKILNLAELYNFYIFEDNAYGYFNWHDNKPLKIKELDIQSRVIYAESFSKTLFPGIRLSIIVVPPSLISEMERIKGYTTVNTSSLSIGMASAWLKNSYDEIPIIIEQAKKLMNHKMEFLFDLLQKAFKENVIITKPQGGFFLRMIFPFEITLLDLENAVINFGVIFSLMSFFEIIPIRKNEIRLAFSYLNELEMIEGVERLKKWYKSLVIEENA